MVNKITVANPPDGIETIKVLELLLTVIAPEDWLLLNVNVAPTGKVVASGNVNV